MLEEIEVLKNDLKEKTSQMQKEISNVNSTVTISSANVII